MGRLAVNFRRDMGTYLFGIWLVLLGFLSWDKINMIQQHWVNVVLGILLVLAGVFHLIEL